MDLKMSDPARQIEMRDPQKVSERVLALRDIL
jgi:hypothetical protein